MHQNIVVGRYVIHSPIASGGMATVYIGQIIGAGGFSRTVAIKRLHPHLASDPEFASVLLDEARLTGAIRHPNVVPALDIVHHERELLLIMEYVAGESLARLLHEIHQRGANIPLRIASAILVGVLAGLHAAHEAQTEDGVHLKIVHRDVSPQNILVGADGSSRLLDFGIAHAAMRAQVTREGQLKGKLRYMAPEQFRRKQQVDRRADVYAAGVVLWEVLTGKKLFDGQSEAEILGNVLEGLVPPPSAYANVPEDIDRVVLCAIAHTPDHRFATAREMQDALAAAVPPASTAEVSAWAETLIGDHLAKRASRVAELARRAPSSTKDAPPPSYDEASAPQRRHVTVCSPNHSTSGDSRRVSVAGSPVPVQTLTRLASDGEGRQEKRLAMERDQGRLRRRRPMTSDELPMVDSERMEPSRPPPLHCPKGFIDDAFPLLVHVAPPVYDAAAIDEMQSAYETYFRHGQRYALLTFSTKETARAGPRERSRIVQWATSSRVQKRTAELCLGSAILVPNAAARRALTALLWFWQPTCPHVSVATPAEGLDWCLAQLARAGMGMPHTSEQLRRLLWERLR